MDPFAASGIPRAKSHDHIRPHHSHGCNAHGRFGRAIRCLPGVHSPRKTHRGFARHVIHTAIFTAQLEIVSTIHVWSIGFVNVCYGYFGLVCWLCQICSQLRRTKDGDPSWFFDSAAELHPSWRTQALELGQSLVRSALIRPSPKEAHPKNLVTLGSI